MTQVNHENVCRLLREPNALPSLGFNDPVFVPRGGVHHSLLLFSRPNWVIAASVPALGFDSCCLHFEYERPGFLLLHCELSPRQGSETKYPENEIRHLLDMKCAIANSVRALAERERWGDVLQWQHSEKSLAEPRNIQVGKFGLGATQASDDAWIADRILGIVRETTPHIDKSLTEMRRN